MDTGESFTVEYVIEFEGDDDWPDWIIVPPVFPNDRWPNPKAWASGLAAEAFEKNGEDRRRFRQMALSLTHGLPPHVDQVAWYAPLDGGPNGVAFMSYGDHDPQVPDAEGWALLGVDESETPVQVTRYPSERFGEIVQSAMTFRLEDQTVAGRLCTVAIGETGVFYLEATNADLALLARMQPGLVGVVDAVRELVAEDEV